VFLTGTSFNVNHADKFDRPTETAYVVNNSVSVIYYLPESKEANPGLIPDEAYKVAPGESLYAPVDAIVTSTTEPGKIFRVPTGGKIIVDEKGVPKAANFIARGGLLFPAYGTVEPPYEGFAKLANSKQVLYHLPDVTVAKRF
jgi:hypothetical protein